MGKICKDCQVQWGNIINREKQAKNLDFFKNVDDFDGTKSRQESM